MSYEQFCLLFGQKDQVFVPQDMSRHIQGTKIHQKSARAEMNITHDDIP
ncbi:MAG: hypothetical protein KDF59_11660 [Nitrosomonas sp.]|nr:hypothetical protein [Nitrosomonas sp.]